MNNGHEYIPSNEGRSMGAEVRHLPDMQVGIEAGWDLEACNLYGKTGRDIINSIQKITGFSHGYPKRITIAETEKGAASWQKFFSWQYEMICKIHGLPIGQLQKPFEL